MLLTAPRHATARVFRALAVAYHQPTQEIYQPQYLEYLREALTEAGAAELLPLVEQMAGGLAATPDLTDLTVAYCKLFFGPVKLVAPPYESVYLGGGVVMGEPALAVLRRYEEARVQLWEGFRECPDHIATELEFLYFTAGEAANFAALRRDATAVVWTARYRTFLQEHLCRWAGAFARKVEDGTENQFYVGLARLTAAWVEREAV